MVEMSPGCPEGSKGLQGCRVGLQLKRPPGGVLFYLPVLQLFELNSNSVRTSDQAVLSPVSEISLFGWDPDQKVPAPGPRAEKSSGRKEGDRQEGGEGEEEEGRVRTSGTQHQGALRGLLSACQKGGGTFLAHHWRPGRLRPPCRSGHSCGPPGCFADIDECADADACGEARCRNLPGSYSCLCDEGYAFSSQEKACRGTHPSRCRHRTHTCIHMRALPVCKHVHCVYAHHTCVHHTHGLLDAAGHLLQHATDTEIDNTRPCLCSCSSRGFSPASTPPAAFGVGPVSSHFLAESSHVLGELIEIVSLPSFLSGALAAAQNLREMIGWSWPLHPPPSPRSTLEPPKHSRDYCPWHKPGPEPSSQASYRRDCCPGSAWQAFLVLTSSLTSYSNCSPRKEQVGRWGCGPGAERELGGQGGTSGRRGLEVSASQVTVNTPWM